MNKPLDLRKLPKGTRLKRRDGKIVTLEIPDDGSYIWPTKAGGIYYKPNGLIYDDEERRCQNIIAVLPAKKPKSALKLDRKLIEKTIKHLQDLLK